MHYRIVWAAKAINCTALLAAVIFKWTNLSCFTKTRFAEASGYILYLNAGMYYLSVAANRANSVLHF